MKLWLAVEAYGEGFYEIFLNIEDAIRYCMERFIEYERKGFLAKGMDIQPFIDIIDDLVAGKVTERNPIAYIEYNHRDNAHVLTVDTGWFYTIYLKEVR